jgi:predicted peptidase
MDCHLKFLKEGFHILKKFICIFIIFAIAISYYFIQKSTDEHTDKISTKYVPVLAETIAPTDTFVERTGSFTYKNQKLQYMLIFPAAYTQTTTQWPLILFLHGSSLRGNSIDLVKNYGPTWVSEQHNDFPCVVLAPQCPENEDWTDKSDILIALLNEIEQKYRIDQNKVYLTGMSLGGRGTWILANAHPEYFAAIAPIAAASTKIPNQWNTKMLSIPIWAFHGENDPIAPLKTETALIDDLHQHGSDAKFTVLPSQGHLIAGLYRNQELYDWFISKTRI